MGLMCEEATREDGKPRTVNIVNLWKDVLSGEGERDLDKALEIYGLNHTHEDRHAMDFLARSYRDVPQWGRMH